MSGERELETDWDEYTEAEDSQRCPEAFRKRFLHIFGTDDVYAVLNLQNYESRDCIEKSIEEVNEEYKDDSNAREVTLVVEDLKTLLLNECPMSRYNKTGDPPPPFGKGEKVTGVARVCPNIVQTLSTHCTKHDFPLRKR